MVSFAFEGAGRLKLPSAEELSKSDESIAILAYTCGTSSDGKPYYAYVAVKPSLYREFHALATAREPLILSDYGNVIVSGFECPPPPEIVREMREKYGFDEHYEEKLIHEARGQQVKFANAQEDKRIMDFVTVLKAKSNGNEIL